MKIHLAFAFALLAAPFAANATPVPGAVANVTLLLSSYDTVPVATNSSNTKVIQTTYRNADLLDELLTEGLLGDGQTSTKGWKLVIVDRTPLLEDSDDTLVFYAVKTGVTPVQIPASRLSLNINLDTGTDSLTEKYNSKEELVSRLHTFRALVGLSGHAQHVSETDGYDYTFDIKALASGSDSFAVRKLKDGSTSVSFNYRLLSQVSLSPALGSVVDSDSNRPITGSVTFSAFVATDISSYPYTPAP